MLAVQVRAGLNQVEFYKGRIMTQQFGRKVESVSNTCSHYKSSDLHPSWSEGGS